MPEDTGDIFEDYRPSIWVTWRSKTPTDQKKLMSLADRVTRAQENFAASWSEGKPESWANETAEELREAKAQFNWHAHAVLGNALPDAESAQTFTGELVKYFANAEGVLPYTNKDGITADRKYYEDLNNLFTAAAELAETEHRVKIQHRPR